MNAPSHPSLNEVQATIEWWRMAGVDCGFVDEPSDWLAATAKICPPEDVPAGRSPTPVQGDAAKAAKSAQHGPSEPDLPRVDLLGTNPPGTLDEFRRWWLEAPVLDAGGVRGRVPPRGDRAAELMVLVVHPEAGDTSELLSGSQGTLLANMLSAMGLTKERAYIASALPRHTPMADTAAIAAGGMDAVTAHHIELVAPRLLLALGAEVRPLLGLGLPDADPTARADEHEWRTIPLMISEGLDSMMAMPRLKARFWRRWHEWMEQS